MADFYRQPSGGFMGRCKECVKERARQYRRDNIDRVREYDRSRSDLEHRIAIRKRVAAQRRADPEQRATDRARVKDWQDRNKPKRQAHVIVGNAIRDGNLIVQPCEVCGDGIGVHAHHDDYAKPLDVMWLCPTHHGERHREINAERRKAVG